jgi:hypothetical protein
VKGTFVFLIVVRCVTIKIYEVHVPYTGNLNVKIKKIKQMSKFKWLGLVVFLSFIGSSCSKNDTNISSIYVPATSDVTANATIDELTQGRQLYINNCSRCHMLYSPDSYTASQWKSIVSVMAPRTSMSAAEVKLVTKYVTRGN